MGTGLVVLANRILRPLGVRLTSDSATEFTMQSALRRTIKHCKIGSVIDMGASDGKWSTDVLPLLPQASFLAVEPLTERESSLAAIKVKHKNFAYEICAAGDGKSSEAVLTVSSDLDGSTIGTSGGTERTISVKSIDALVAKHKLPGPYLLKFDTHGYEVQILRGATQTLKDTAAIIMEVYNYPVSSCAERFPQMCLMLEEMGFRCADLADPMLRNHDKTFWQMDLFFLPRTSKIFDFSQFD